jgi:hypothetical protein
MISAKLASEVPPRLLGLVVLIVRVRCPDSTGDTSRLAIGPDRGSRPVRASVFALSRSPSAPSSFASWRLFTWLVVHACFWLPHSELPRFASLLPRAVLHQRDHELTLRSVPAAAQELLDRQLPAEVGCASVLFCR